VKQWEHRVCSKISDNEYKMLDGASVNIIFLVLPAVRKYQSFSINMIMIILNKYDYDNQIDTKFEVIHSNPNSIKVLNT